MKILVCGGRDFTDRDFVFKTLDRVLATRDIEALVHGDARGADRLAGDWAAVWGIEVKAYPAEWDRLGKVAGFIRNQKMLGEELPEVVIAFPGGRGTADMVRRAKKYPSVKHVWEPKPPPDSL